MSDISCSMDKIGANAITDCSEQIICSNDPVLYPVWILLLSEAING